MKRGSGSGAARRQKSSGHQLELRFRTWGGSRKGAGRKPRSGSTVRHSTRPAHSRHHPLHVTLRVDKGVPSLRGKVAFRAVKRSLLLANTRSKHRQHFRITHYSVQGNHVHLVAEASSRERLSRGIQGLSARIARRVNLATGRTGRLFAERYHCRALRSPREVRHALAYVLLNERHHLHAQRGLSLPPWYFDSFSSAAEFDSWRPLFGLDPPPPPVRDVTVAPQTFLLSRLWKRHGLIAPDEVPGGPRRRR
jgi:hypothetical protein